MHYSLLINPVSISTKTGDDGKTSLFSGEECNKDNPRVEAYGTVDELNAHLSEAKHLVEEKKTRSIIIELQNDLFKLAGSLATIGDYKYPLEESDVKKLTNYVYEFEKEVELKGFVIPGNTPASAKLDICRTIARRAERRILSLNKTASVSKILLKYVNRLSDLLFIMARIEEKNEDKLEFKKWK